ncbi:MAG TPA: SMP-30/gluconolactonase/LRE family protein [Verrucomicrobium sp.]|nr:SMP-30/gluconolactonase/LRE family protein [Verrucomicrobium sp.]
MKLLPAASLSLLLASTLSAADWVPLFDGKTLEGFTQKGGKATYKVEEEAVVGTTAPNTPNSFLCTNKDYGDFVLELEFKVDPRMNSGVQFRSESKPDYKNGQVHGYQFEIDPADRAWSGGIYDEGRRGWLASLETNDVARYAFKQNDWNKLRVEAVGERIRTFLNDIPAADLKDGMTPKGFIALQVHGVGKNESEMQVRWRKIRLMENPTPTDLTPEKVPTKAPANLVAEGAEVKLLQGGFKFTEGPALAPDGRIFFTDIPNNRIHIYDPASGQVTIHRENTGGANGLMFTPTGALLACEMKARKVTREANGELKTVVDKCDGKKLNQSNDMDLDGKGGYYFTDPNYGQKDDIQMDKRCVYYVDRGGKVSRVVDDCVLPNGIVLSLDKKTLYVGDNGMNKIRAYDVQADGKVANGRDFAKMAADKATGGDGMTIDQFGNIYMTAQEFVWVFDASGKVVTKIKVPEDPANCTFGRNNMLYITAKTGFYGVKMNVGGRR